MITCAGGMIVRRTSRATAMITESVMQAGTVPAMMAGTAVPATAAAGKPGTTEVVRHRRGVYAKWSCWATFCQPFNTTLLQHGLPAANMNTCNNSCFLCDHLLLNIQTRCWCRDYEASQRRYGGTERSDRRNNDRHELPRSSRHGSRLSSPKPSHWRRSSPEQGELLVMECGPGIPLGSERHSLLVQGDDVGFAKQ
jgi:hypothetical protein